MKIGMFKFVFGLSIACCLFPVKADNIAYFLGANDFGEYPGQFGTLDLDTGVFSSRGNLGQVLAGAGVANGILYAVSWNTTNSVLYSVNTANGSLSAIGASAVNFYDFGSTTSGLFAVGKDMNLYSINSANGAATLIGPTGLASFVGITIGLSTASDNLYFTRGANLYTLDTSTGAATLIGNMGDSATIGAIVLEGGTLYGGANTPQFQVDTLNPVTAAATSGSSVGTGEPFWGFAPVSSINPQLSIQLTNSQILVSWPAGYTGFELQSTGSLLPSDWTTVTNAPFATSLLQTVYLNLSPTNQFFRLRMPSIVVSTPAKID